MPIPLQDLIALATGESVIAFVERGSLFEGDEFPLEAGTLLRPQDVKAAYSSWAGRQAPAGRIGIVEAIHPVTALDADSGSANHIRATRPDHGDLAVVRVYGPDGPVLSDEAFAARRAAVDGAISF